MGLNKVYIEWNERLVWCGYANEQLSNAPDYTIFKPEQFEYFHWKYLRLC